MPNILEKLFSTGAKNIIDSVGNTLDKIITTKAEKLEIQQKIESEINRHIEYMQTEATKIEIAYLQDVQDARKMNMEIQGTQPSWLAKNLAYCIDAFITVLWGGLTCYLMAVMLQLAPRQQGVDYTAVTAVWGAVSATFSIVINYHRGSSQSSQDKQKKLYEKI